MEYRLRRYDGEYRWLLDVGVPRFNADHSFAGYIGSCLDVTERKLAEDALSGICRKLIEAQEQERSRIARELHDDINQRLALVAIGLEQVAQLEQNPSKRVAEVSFRIHELGERVSEIGTEVQAISHRLHSSKLEYLGIVSAAKSFCKEFGDQQKVDIAFAHDEIPRTVPQETSLCLFRVLQEALQNAVKHSGVRKFEVALSASSDAIHLTVSDSGSGFDLEEGMKASGLGLISMVERLKLVDGQLSIDTRPESGTSIHARVPLRKAARAAG
jgi:signal transduction histidine kinase